MRSSMNYYIKLTQQAHADLQVKITKLSADMVTAQENAYSFYQVD